ncbi:toll-like receptor 4 [Pseudophryne corroboree]|uniref:toll-like receptor 4 n=1 Tax=Pseudophryne corroboree TaxID=495146 RepID=UPI003081B66E
MKGEEVGDVGSSGIRDGLVRESEEFEEDYYMNSTTLHEIPQMSLKCCNCNLSVVPVDLPQNLRKLDLSFNNLQHLYNKQFSQLSKLQLLDLTRCSIISIEDHAFSGLDNLHTLILTGNPVAHWSPLTFSGLTLLHRLIVVETSLTSLSALPVGQLTLLKELNAARNLLKILHVPSFLFSLNTVDLRANKITEIKENDLENLQNANTSHLTLILSQNPVQSISPGAFRFISLQALDLKGCFSTADTMKANLKALSGLHTRKLVIGHYRNSLNKIKFKNGLLEGLCGVDDEELTINGMFFDSTHPFLDCTENVTSLRMINTYMEHSLSYAVISSIEKFELKNSLLTNVPSATISKFRNLKEIRITDNRRLSKFDDDLTGLNRLELLDLSRNQLHIESCCYHIISGVTVLKHLNFSYNVHIGLRTVFLNMSHLRSLDLSHSEIDSVGQFPVFNLMDKLTYLDLSYTSCHFRIHCSFCGLTHLEQLYLSHTKFATEILALVFQNLTQLRILDMSSCGLQHIPAETFAGLILLQELNLSKNILWELQSSVLNPLTALTSLDISANNFQGISEDTAQRLSQNITKVDISQNPYDCSCSQQTFLLWVHEHSSAFLSFSELMVCKTPNHFHGEKLSDVYLNCSLTLYVFAGVFVIVISSLVAVFTYRCYSQKYFYLCYLSCQTPKNHIAGKEYDAFVIHSSLDEEWVKEQLVPKLEGSVPPFQLCLHYRDFVPGIPITSNIVNEGIRRSRNALIIVSQNFMESKWCSFEFEMAMSWQFLESQCGIIVILLEAVEDVQLKQMIGLNKYLRKNTYLKWADGYLERKVFWMRLSEALRKGSQITRCAPQLEDTSEEILYDKHNEQNKMNL